MSGAGWISHRITKDDGERGGLFGKPKVATFMESPWLTTSYSGNKCIIFEDPWGFEYPGPRYTIHM